MTFTLGIPIVSGSNSGGSSEKATTNDAKKAALEHIITDIKNDPQSSWKGKKISLSKPIELFDSYNELKGYLFNIFIDNNAKGYITIGNNLNEFPVLEWTYEQSNITEKQLKTAKEKINKAKQLKDYKVVYFGVGKYGFKFNFSDDSSQIIGTDGTKIASINNEKIYNKLKENNDSVVKEDKKDDPEQARKFWGHIKNLSVGEIGDIYDGVTDVNPDTWYYSTCQWMSWDYISGVTDFNTYSYDYYGDYYPTSCAPAAATNMMWFLGYRESTIDSTMFSLRSYLQTYNFYNYEENRNDARTDVEDIQPGLQNYAKAKKPNTNPVVMENGDYSPGNSCAWSHLTYEVNIQRPSLISVIGQTWYVNHAVTLIGYKQYCYNNTTEGHEFMIIRDNTGVTPVDVYMAYGRDYIYLVQYILIP